MLRMLTCLEHSVTSVCISADGKFIASGCSDDRTVKIWSKGSSGTFECESTLRGDKAVHCVSFSPDGDMLAAGDGDYQGGNVRLYDVQTGEVKSTLTGHTGYVPAPPCSAHFQSRFVCSLSSDAQHCLERRV